MKRLILSAFMIASSSIYAQQKQMSIDDLFSKMQKDKTNESIKNGSYCDIEEAQALKLFSNSNIRVELDIKIREFNYSLFKIFAKQFKIPMSKMIIFNSTNNIKTIEELKEAYKGANNPQLCKECYYIPFKFRLNN